MSQIKDISNSLEATIKDSNLQDVTIGLIETLSDSVLQDGILRDIPIVSTIVGLSKTGIKINERLFLKKIVSFISELNEIPAEKRSEMIAKIDNSEKYRINIGEKLLYIIDKCDDYEKSQLIGKLFKAFILEKMNYDSFIRCVLVVHKAAPNDLMWFVNGNWVELSVEESAECLNWGVFELKPLSIEIKESDNLGYLWNDEKNYEIKGGQLRASINTIGRKIREALKE